MPKDADATAHFIRRGALIAMAAQRYFMTSRCNPLEDLMEMDLGAARKRVCYILPVKYKYFQWITAPY